MSKWKYKALLTGSGTLLPDRLILWTYLLSTETAIGDKSNQVVVSDRVTDGDSLTTPDLVCRINGNSCWEHGSQTSTLTCWWKGQGLLTGCRYLHEGSNTYAMALHNVLQWVKWWGQMWWKIWQSVFLVWSGAYVTNCRTRDTGDSVPLSFLNFEHL